MVKVPIGVLDVQMRQQVMRIMDPLIGSRTTKLLHDMGVPDINA